MRRLNVLELHPPTSHIHISVPFDKADSSVFAGVEMETLLSFLSLYGAKAAEEGLELSS